MLLPSRSLLLSAMLLASTATRLLAPETVVKWTDGPEAKVPIHLLADSLHTGLVFDLRWLVECGFVKPAEIGDHQYVVMSWGDEVAYSQERWLSPGQVFQALFMPTPSVMECIPFDWKVEEVCLHQRVFRAEVPHSAGIPLARFLNRYSAMKPDGTPQTIAPSGWGDGRLIRCPDACSYHFPRMCNDWTARALGSAGFQINASNALSAEGLIRQAISQGNGFRLTWDPWEEKATRTRELRKLIKSLRDLAR